MAFSDRFRDDEALADKRVRTHFYLTADEFTAYDALHARLFWGISTTDQFARLTCRDAPIELEEAEFWAMVVMSTDDHPGRYPIWEGAGQHFLEIHALKTISDGPSDAAEAARGKLGDEWLAADRLMKALQAGKGSQASLSPNFDYGDDRPPIQTLPRPLPTFEDQQENDRA